MRLITLTVQGFRGFNQKNEIEFARDLTVAYGKNGMGKTSLGEALEWLLYGKTAKRVKGDTISKREYSNSYKNVHYTGTQKPFVELVAKFTDGTSHVLRRELNPDESSSAFLDTSPCASFGELGIASEFGRPMILQHTLQDFIHMPPKQRYTALSSMLGLEPLMVLRANVDTLQGPGPESYAKRKPKRARDARQFLDDLRADAQSYEQTKAFTARLSLRPEALPKARDDLAALIADALDEVVPEDQVPARLRKAVMAAEKAVLDWRAFAVPEVSHETISIRENGLSACAERARGFLKVLSSHEKVHSKRMQRQFYELGLQQLRLEEPKVCPFCEHPTLTPERIAAIRERVRTPATDEDEHSALAEEYRTYSKSLPHLLPEASDVLPTVPNEREKEVLARLLPNGAKRQAEVFETAASAAKQHIERLEEAREAVLIAADALSGRLRGEKKEEDTADELPELLEAFAARVQDALAAAQTYEAAYKALDSTVGASISSQRTVNYLGLLEKAWCHWGPIQIAVYDRHVEESLLELRRDVMAFTSKKIKQILEVRMREIKAWYNELNADEPVTFQKIDIGTDNLPLIAESFGKPMAAAPNLSSSHLNCLGIAVYLACATREGSPFGFLLIDDPVQSMDEDHTEAFKVKVIRKLLDKGFQLVILTHLKGLAKSIEGYHHRSCDLLSLHFATYAHTGPSIEIQLPALRSYLANARDYMNADGDHMRAVAVTSLRRFVERFVKDLYVAQTSKSVPRRFQDANWFELKRILLQCKDFKPTDESRLNATHDFTSTHLHEDDTQPQDVPKPHQIQVYVSDMESLLDDYRHILGV